MIEKLINLKETLEVGPLLYNEEMKTIYKELSISKNTPKDDLVNVRNQVVIYYSDRKDEAREAGDYDTFDIYNNAMSKITCSIDYLLMEK